MTGVAADISHINTKSVVKGYDPTPSGLREALSGAEIVLIPAGVPRKPGMTRDGMLQRVDRLMLDAKTDTQISSTPTLLSSVTLLKQLPMPRQMLTFLSSLIR